MRRSTLAVDTAIAVIAAIVLIVVSPGLAVVGIIALLVLVVCALSLAVDTRRIRARERRLRRMRPPRDRRVSARRR